MHAGVLVLTVVVSLAAFVQLHAQETPANADFCVATDGNDANPGTGEKPFATPARARDAVRRLVAEGLKGDVTVEIRGGTYELSETLKFGPEDSGNEKHSVTWAASPGVKVIWSGGRKVTGWKRGEDETWSAAVPGVRQGKWCFHQLWVNGRRAVRARSPNRDAETPYWQMTGAELAKDFKRYTFTFAPGLLGNWKNVSDVEVVTFGEWEINRKRLESIDEKAGVAVLAPPHIPSRWNEPRRGRWCYFENARELLDEPGEWYLDRETGTLSYRPRPGEDVTRSEVVAPVLTRLVEVTGTAERPVRKIHFKGIAFEHTDWTVPPGGYLGVQACHYRTAEHGKEVSYRIPAAVRWDYVEESSLQDGVIAHLGGCGVELVNGCHKDLIQGNHVFDVSANGVMLGGPTDEPTVPRDDRIANNHVHACGVDYPGAVGIWVGFAHGAAVSHNLVHDLPYTGISLGWQWDPKPTPCRENLVECNDICDVMKRLGDGGGIYTLGFQPGTVIRGNHIHDVRRSRFAQAAPNNGMFIDEGSKGFLFERNVIYNTAAQPVRFNACSSEWHTWRDNHFGSPPSAQGKVGTALACDGVSTFVEAPHSPALDSPELTVEAWIYLTEFPAGNDARRWIVNKNRNEWVEGHYALAIESDRLGAYLNIGGGRTNCCDCWSPKGALTLNRWHHAAMTYDGEVLKVHSDGKLVGSKDIHKKRVPGTSPVNIGRRQDAFVYFKGMIDEVRIYDRALSADELKTHVDSPAKVKDVTREKGLAGCWSFDELPESQGVIREIIAQAGLEARYREGLSAKD